MASASDAVDFETADNSPVHGGSNSSSDSPIGDDAPNDPSSPANFELDRDLLPTRLFATDRYPKSVRVNSYSKPEYLLELVDVLDGTTELEWLKSSCFGGLFRLPLRKSSLSGKLIHQLLCRSLVTDKRHEMWFVFGGRPIRFSLREFGILTGLNCGEYPSRQAIRKMLTPTKKKEKYINKLIGPNSTYTIPEVIDILKEDRALEEAEKMDTDRRKRLALVVIVDGILVCDTSKVVATVEVAEMLKDLDAFMQYPWGRKSFDFTLEMVIVGKKNRTVNILADKLSQSHIATHGFTLAFQLLILQAVPLLQQFLPELDPGLTFIDLPVSQLTMCKTFHNSNILQVEMDQNLQVESIIHPEVAEDINFYSWVDELDDDGIDYIISKLKDGHTFQKEDWHGGFDDLPLLSLPVKTKRKKAATTRVKSSVFRKHTKSKFDDPSVEEEAAMPSKVDTVTAEELLKEVDRRNMELLKEVDRRNMEHTSQIKQMIAVQRAIDKDEIRDHVLAVLREKGLLKSSVNINHTDLLNQMNNSTWVDYGEGLPDIFNNIRKVVDDPQIGEEANQSQRRVSDDDFFERRTSVEQSFSSPDCGGTVNNNVDIGLRNVDGRQVVPDEDIGLVDVDGIQVVPDEGIPTISYVQEHLSDKGISNVGANVIEETAEILEHLSPKGIGSVGNNPTIEEVIAKPQNDEDCNKDSAQMGANVIEETAEILIQKEAISDNHMKLQQDRSSTSEFSTSQTSETSQTDDINPAEPASPSSKKRSLLPDELAESSLPKKRQRRKPRRFDDSSSKKPINPGHKRRDNYSPFRVVKPELKKKFLSTLRAYKQKDYIISGHSVKSSFFEDIYTPKHWVDTPHMESMLSLLWKMCGDSFAQSRVAVLDTWFTYILCNDHSRFQKKNKNSAFPWNNVIKNYVRGIVPDRSSNMAWFTDVDTVYVPMNWGKRHWVACVIYLQEGKILILDPLIVNNDAKKLPRLMKPLLDMLPFVIKDIVTPAPADCRLPTAFTFERALDVYQNVRTGDCGPLAVKFIELHAQGLPMDNITDKMVDEMRMSFAVDIYEEFVVSLS